MKSGIYKIQNQVNDKVYIGSGIIEDRFIDHRSKLKNNKHSNNHLQSSWDKYGEGSFKFKPVIYCGSGGLSYYEELLIVDVFESYKRENGYNFKIGRGVGNKHSEKTKRKISESLKNYYKDNEHTMKGKQRCKKIKNKISNNVSGKSHPLYGEERPEKVKNKISENMPDFSNKNNPFYGQKHTEKSKNKIRKNMPDFSGENNPFYGETHDDETIKKMNGEDQGGSKLKKEEVIEIKNKISNNKEYKKIANQYNVSKSLISQIKSGEVWGHINL